MEELFCIQKSEARTQFGSIPEVEEGCPAEVVHVLFMSQIRFRLVTMSREVHCGKRR